MPYPLKFQDNYKSYLWGGRNLSKFGKKLPPAVKIAESWEISEHPKGISIIANGDLAGKTLPEVIELWGSKMSGQNQSPTFPLLVKLIDAREALSIQVHPNDRFARIFEGESFGKNEMWYVVAARPGARLIAGLRPGIDDVCFAEAVRENRCLEVLRTVPVCAGDAINIPAGMVHAIGDGLIICEIQQNSDLTYRIYDYDRYDINGHKRPLHLDKALAVIDYTTSAVSPLLPGLVICQTGVTRRILVLNRFFMVEELTVSGIAHFSSDGSRFITLTVLKGEGKLIYRTEGALIRQCCEHLTSGQSVLVPASLGDWQLEGQMKLITSCVSDFAADLQRLAITTGFGGESVENLTAMWKEKVGMEPRP